MSKRKSSSEIEKPAAVDEDCHKPRLDPPGDNNDAISAQVLTLTKETWESEEALTGIYHKGCSLWGRSTYHLPFHFFKRRMSSLTEERSFPLTLTAYEFRPFRRFRPGILMPPRRRVPPAGYRCFNCESDQHYKSDCPKEAEVCSKCGKGHLSVYCKPFPITSRKGRRGTGKF